MVGEDGVLQFLSALEEREEREHHGQGEGKPEQDVAGLCHAALEGEQGLVEATCIGGGVDAKQHPSHVDDEEGEDDGRPLARLLQQVFQEELVSADEQAVEGTPEDEGPAGAVPQSREQEAEPQVEVHAPFALAVATQRDVEVVHDEVAEGHVPAFPELGDAAAGVGVVEVFGELESHHLAETDGHVAVAREVEVDLEGVGEDADPCCTRGQVAVVHGEDLVGIGGQGVGDEHFLAQADDEAVEAHHAVFHGAGALHELRRHAVVVDDGTRDELRKHHDIQHIVGQLVARRRGATIHVYGVGDALEGEEANADGQRHFHPAYRLVVHPTKDGVEVLHEEVGILEVQQQPQGHDDRQSTEPFLRACLLGLGHASHDEVVDDAFPDEQENEVGGAIGVEDEGKQQERVVPELPWRDEIRRKEYGQKKEKEYVATEDHGYCSFFISFWLNIYSAF